MKRDFEMIRRITLALVLHLERPAVTTWVDG